VLAVLDTMLAHGWNAWRLPLQVARRLQALGYTSDDAAVLLEVATVLVRHPATLALPCIDAMEWVGDPVLLAAAIGRGWRKVRTPESPFDVAVSIASTVPIPAELAAASPTFRRCYQVLAALQRLVGTAAIHPGQEKVAAALGCTQRQVSSYFAALVYLERLEVVDASYSFTDRRHAKRYRVRLPEAP
jgi:hypothetical protein